MFGKYPYPVSLSQKDVTIDVTPEGAYAGYTRTCRGDRVEKVLGSPTGSILVNPVEPTNLPEDITNVLEIMFSPIVLKPGAATTVYLTFPVEIAVFLEANGLFDVFDLFSLNNTKYSLYGPPQDGIITRWYRSRINPAPPEVDPLREGVMELSIRNSSQNSQVVSRGIFEQHQMALWYGEGVSLIASMELFSGTLAETRFSDRPLHPGMTRSLDLYAARKIPVVQNVSYFMEFGVS